jgi:hypothetical protein
MRSFFTCSTVRIVKSETCTWHDEKEWYMNIFLVEKSHRYCGNLPQCKTDNSHHAAKAGNIQYIIGRL